MSNKYLLNAVDPAKTPQREALPGQVQNSAGGYSFAVSPWNQLNRFLILGSEGGSYYAGERDLTKSNLTGIKALIKQDGVRVVNEVVAVSLAGRAPKNDPALLVLALCMSEGNDATRSAAFGAISKVARTGTHLFHLAQFVDSQRGWGRGLRKAFASWYLDRSPRSLANQVVKYQQRDGWSHRDLLRLSHPVPENDTRKAIFNYVTQGWPSIGADPHPDSDLALLWATERAKTASEPELVRLIDQYHLPMEVIPTDKRSKAVYEALIPEAGITWLIRNLGNLSKSGAIAEGQYSRLNQVVNRITSVEQLKAGRVHPIQILSALMTYSSGSGFRSSSSWPVIQKIKEALDEAFYLAFDAVEPTGKRYVLGLDISGSMDMGTIAGISGLNPRMASAAMAMTTYKLEPNCVAFGFTSASRYGYGWAGTRAQASSGDAIDSAITRIDFSANERLDRLVERMRQLPMGGTDCALPMLWASKHRIEADTFIVYTDNETWAGNVHPVQALREYRQIMGIPARLIVVGMVSNGFTIADPNDGGMLDIAGFDSSAPSIIAEFSQGNI